LKLVGVYTSQRDVLEAAKTGVLEWLKDNLGLNLVIVSGGIPSPEVIAKTPIKVVSETGDRLSETVNEAHKKDIGVWLVYSTFAEMAGGPTYPDLAFRDIEGNIVAPESKHGSGWAWSWCPSNPRLREYYAALYNDLTKRYDVDGFTISHNRYSPPGHEFYNLFGCACPNCVKTAAELGYDFPRMKASLQTLLRNLKQVDWKKLEALAEVGPSFLDFLYYAGPDTGLIDWVNFRCDLILTALKKFYEAVKEAREDITFGQDTFPPSFSLLAGHKYRELEATADFLSPLLSHPFLFIIFSFMETTAHLIEWNRSLRERAVLKVLYRLFGYDKLAMPESLNALVETKPIPSSDFSATKVPVPDIIKLECLKAGAMARRRVPIYPVIAARNEVTAEGATARVKAVKEAGLDGVILQVSGFPGREDNLAAVSRVLRE